MIHEPSQSVDLVGMVVILFLFFPFVMMLFLYMTGDIISEIIRAWKGEPGT